MPADAPDQPPIWRSLGEKADPTRRAKQAVEEPAVQVPEKSILGRRSFLAVTGATGAAVTLSGCLRRPAENILPYSHAPEHIVPGVPLHFATAVQHHGDAVGLLVETHEGRPTKVEGNPDHPGSLGKTDAQLQATILELYDPARPAFPSTKGDAEARTSSTWPDFEAMWREKAASLGSGRGLAVLMQPTSSPSYIRAREALLRRFPDARAHVVARRVHERARGRAARVRTAALDRGRLRPRAPRARRRLRLPRRRARLHPQPAPLGRGAQARGAAGGHGPALRGRGDALGDRHERGPPAAPPALARRRVPARSGPCWPATKA
ncbi:MAG: hypothetical protein M5U28_31700 [Sandaracinaceae bacterium]|nr:hypothetical protein [Sandaracinaceae bacterium]